MKPYPRNNNVDSPRVGGMKKMLNYFTEGFPSRRDVPAGIAGCLHYLRRIIEENPIGLRRILRFQPIFTLATSVLCVTLFRHGFEYIPIVIAFLIFALFTITSRIFLITDRKGFIIAIWDMAFMFVLNNLLLFAIPFYVESTTFPSRNMAFVAILVIIAAASGWYELYDRFIAKHPLRSSLFYATTIFSVLNIILPVLFGIRNIWSLLLSMSMSLLVIAAVIYPHIALTKKPANMAAFALGIIISFTLIWTGRSAIPPAPLKITRATAYHRIENFRPQDPFTIQRYVPNEDICFYTSIFAPRGLKEKIDHVWHHNGRRLFRVPLSEIHGGRAEGFGTWSCHTIREGPGTYTVEVWTAGGQILGSGSFTLR